MVGHAARGVGSRYYETLLFRNPRSRGRGALSFGERKRELMTSYDNWLGMFTMNIELRAGFRQGYEWPF
jgi:hypothetical protein